MLLFLGTAVARVEDAAGTSLEAEKVVLGSTKRSYEEYVGDLDIPNDEWERYQTHQFADYIRSQGGSPDDGVNCGCDDRRRRMAPIEKIATEIEQAKIEGNPRRRCTGFACSVADMRLYIWNCEVAPPTQKAEDDYGAWVWGDDWDQEIGGGEFNFAGHTIVYTHGFNSQAVGSVKSKSARVMVEQYCTRPNGKPNDDYNRNFIAVDWSTIAAFQGGVNGYHWPMSQVSDVGAHLGRLITAFLQVHGANGRQQWTKMHFVGHSLGAHVSANAARMIMRLEGRKVEYITGLDPAGPGFVGESAQMCACGLHKEDAEYVDIIHTNGKREKPFVKNGKLGNLNVMGDADYYINGGESQGTKQCPTDYFGFCSHRRAKDFFAWALQNHSRLIAYECANSEDAVNKEKLGVFDAKWFRFDYLEYSGARAGGDDHGHGRVAHTDHWHDRPYGVFLVLEDERPPGADTR